MSTKTEIKPFTSQFEKRRYVKITTAGQTYLLPVEDGKDIHNICSGIAEVVYDTKYIPEDPKKENS